MYKSVSVSGAVYSYYYDAANRRRLKEYPTSETDEFFYDANNHLLVDRGNSSVTSPSYFTTDEYVWLGARPVLVVRGRLSTSDDSRSADTTSTCGRNGNSETCGAYFIITDDLPKPVALLDDTGKHARRLNWDAFGAVNQRELRNAETPHPYANSNSYALFYETLPVLSGMTLKYRFRLDAVDSEGSAGSPVDSLAVMHNWVTQSTTGGAHRGRVFTPWVSQSPAATYLLFTSSARNCPPEGCLTDGGYPDGGSFPYYGISSTMVELVESQSGAKEFDLPLRFPGQYYDAETQKHENWNRYYDPPSGRYLSPEPLLQEPMYVRRIARSGMGVPTYSYAANNPLRYVDANGLYFTVSSPNANAIWSSLQRLAANRQIGWAIEQMAADPSTEFQINEIPYENCGESGARTWPPYERNARGDLTIPIDFNLARSNADLATYFPGRGYELWTLELLLGHELGHANGMAYGSLSHFDMGLDWERALRNQSPLRLDHDQGGQCVNRCRGQ